MIKLPLTSKELTGYISFLKRLNSIGNDFLIKGDIWLPCIKNEKNTPGTHIGRDPILTKLYNTDDMVYSKYTCSHLEDTLNSLKNDMPKGRKTSRTLEITDTEISIQINDDIQWVIASKYIESTDDFCPEWSMFNDILQNRLWSELSNETLQNINDYHPVSIFGRIADTEEITKIRLAKNLFKLSGVRKRVVDFSGEYSLKNTSLFDETVADLAIHMNYPAIECVHLYYIRKY